MSTNGNTALTINEVRAQMDEHGELERADDKARNATREELTYRLAGENSYFADLVISRTDKRGATEAGERLEHHYRQMKDMPVQVRSLPGAEFEHRVNPNTTAGKGGEFAPPLWVNEYFATARRPGRVIQRLAHNFDLPEGVSSINLPRITTGTMAGSSVPGGAISDQDVETEAAKTQCVVFAGNSDWSIQAFEQSPQTAHVDWVVTTDLAESIDAEVERELIVGTGAANYELLGLLNITGINAVSYATLEAKTLYLTLGKAMAKVGIERKRPPDAFLLTTARIAHLATIEDSEQRALLLTDVIGSDFPVASLATTAVYPDDAIPRTVNVNQEPMFCVRSDDFLMWLSPPKTSVMTDVLSGSLEVRIRAHRTVGAILNRYPSGISAITGAGTKPATEF